MLRLRLRVLEASTWRDLRAHDRRDRLTRGDWRLHQNVAAGARDGEGASEEFTEELRILSCGGGGKLAVRESAASLLRVAAARVIALVVGTIEHVKD